MINLRCPYALLLATAYGITSMATAQAADVVTVRVASVAPEGTPWEQQIRRTAKSIFDISSGKVKLKFYLGGKKGDEKSLVRQCRDGSVELVAVSTAALATQVPALQVLELPFLFDSTAEADYILDEHLYGPVKKLLAKRGYTMYQWAENGWQNFGLKDAFVTGPAALKGRKMRSQESPVHLATWRGFGASPVEMSVSEVLPALKTGLVEGFGQTPLFTFAAGWHQGIKHYTISHHVYQPAIMVYSKKWFDKQSKPIQNALLSNIETDTKAGRLGVRQLEPGLLQNFVAYGIKLHELTPSERADFKVAAATIRKQYEKTASRSAKRLLRAIDEGRKAFRKRQQ